MKTFEEIKSTNYFHVLADDMKLVLEANEIIWENINARNFYEVFTRFYQDSAIYEDFKAFSDNRKLADVLRILADAGAVVDAVQKMSHSDFSGMSVYFIEYKVRATLFGEVLMYVLEENMEKITNN